MALLGLAACLLLAMGGCARLVTAPTAEPEVGTSAVYYTVLNGDDSGPGSLRQMLLDAPAGATITFDSSVTVVDVTSGSLVIGTDLTIAGPDGGTVTLRGNGTASVVSVSVAGVDVILRNLTITGGHAVTGGGVHVEWPGNWLDEPPSLSLYDCTVHGNVAGDGGGVYTEGALHVERSTIHGNSTTGGSGGGIMYVGTAIDGTEPYPASATIVNSTISGNTAPYSAGVENFNGELRILFSTITGNRNTATTSSAGGISSYNDSMTRTVLKGAIVVGNTDADGANDVYGRQAETRYVSLGYNLIGAGGGTVDFDLEFTATGDLTDVTVTAASLQALAANGGPTLTHALFSGSVALDLVPTEVCTDLSGVALANDQRGVARPQGTACDAGAFESDSAITAYTLYVTVDPEGTGTVTGAGLYTSGATPTLTATPATHWTFSHWSGDLEGTENPATLTMDANKAITAHFVQATYVVTTHPDGAGSVDGGGTYVSGATATLTAVPFPGAAFDHWSGDATGSTNPIVLTVTSNLDVTAHFVLAHTLDVTVEGEGEVTTDPSVGPYADGTVVTLTATPAPGWFFQMWTGSVTGSVNPVTLELRDSEGVTAVFQPVLGPMLSVAIEGEGLVTSEPSGIHCRRTGGACLASYPKNTRVTLYAVADDGSAFLRWSGSATDTTPDVTIRLRDDAQATAYFTELNGPVVAIDRTGSFRGSTAIVTGSLVCAAGSTYDLDVSILQEGPVKKDLPQLVSASTTVLDAACGQPWTATLIAEDARFVRGDAEVTVTVDGVSKTVLVQLR